MENSQHNQLAQVMGVPRELSTTQAVFYQGLTTKEQGIYRAKYSGPRIQHIGADQLATRAGVILFRISVITGWLIPDDKLYQDALAAELFAKLTESYGDVTIDEIFYAMRNFSNGVEDYGKPVNLQLIDKVMDKYLTERRRLSDKEQTHQHQPEQRILNGEQLMHSERERAEWCYQMYLRGIELKNPQSLAAILEVDFNLIDADVLQFFKQRALAGISNLYIRQN